MPIRTLPTLVINQIAAGEVIERPASVVKELVENALDAGATRIDIAIEEGGTQLIRISDDGIGIPADELVLAVSPHATSKITASEELEAIATLGFRGEALASIASISRLRITSRARKSDGRIEEAAGVLEVEGDLVKGPIPGAGKPGTVIEVRDLFFNTPARRKFMRSPASEFGHINDTLSRIAMVNPDCGFTLTHNGRGVRDLSPNQPRRERCIELLGKDLAEGLLAFEHHDDPVRGSAKVWGLAGLPSLARATSKFQHVCVNGRPIKDRNLAHAIKEAYRGLMPPDKFPMVVLFIDLDPAHVDVNVHPQKAEVRFRHPSHVHGLVLTALRQRLLGADLTPSAQVRGAMFDVRSIEPATADIGNRPSPIEHQTSNIHTASDFVNYFRAMDPRQKGFVYSEVKRQLQAESPEEVGEEDDVFEERLLSRQAAQQQDPNPQTPNPNSYHILQVHDSYVVTQDEHGLVIIDQHALHERVMFEELRKRILQDKASLESQRLLMPVVIEADASRQSALEELSPLLERLGIEAGPIGPNQVAVHAFPSLLFSRNVKVGPFMQELLDKAEAGAFDKLDLGGSTGGHSGGSDQQLPEEAALHEVLDMMSCKAAIKAGDKMSPTELTALLAKRDEIERSSNCPHGRPTTLRLTLKDLERQFGRS